MRRMQLLGCGGVEKLSVFIMVADVATRWRLFSANNSVSLYPLKILRPLSARHTLGLHIHMYTHTHTEALAGIQSHTKYFSHISASKSLLFLKTMPPVFIQRTFEKMPK